MPRETFPDDLLILPACDETAAMALDLPVGVVLAGPDGRWSLAGQEAAPRALAHRVLGGAVLSRDGQEAWDGNARDWEARTGQALPPVLTLREGDRAGAGLGLAGLYRDRLQAVACHNADLLQMLAGLRADHEQTAAELRQLEDFTLGSLQAGRWLVQSHVPLPLGQSGVFDLPPGTDLHQRLIGGSAGLSDLALYRAVQEAAPDGALDVALTLAGSGQTVAAWTVAAPALQPGWLRLSLERALPADDQGMDLTLRWNGTSPLRLGAGLYHPDPAFCARIGEQHQNRILAQRIWKYVPGRLAPAPTGAHWTHRPPPGPRHVPPEDLADLAASAPHREGLEYLGALRALQVHPRKDSIALARLPQVVPPGTREIRALVGGRDPRVPAVEYALAIAPPQPLREPGDLAMESARQGLISDWLCLEGEETGDLLLWPRGPVERLHDLCLLTRVPPGGSTDFGWATFRDIRLSF